VLNSLFQCLAKYECPNNRREKGNELEVVNGIDFTMKSGAAKELD
jgi:hypothetical protein